MKIIPEITEHAMYLMQILKIGKSEVLTFFDSGANVNLIEGDLAIRENLQCISDKPSSLSVVGGNQIKTEYGQYTFSLGPTSENEFHTLTCLGMDSVTNEFSKYDLADIIQEFRSKSNNSDKHVSLPPYAAGSSVKLLIGIKNNKLDPTLIEVLPSGIGVYRSPFVDVFGSDIIFAGPHATFTRGNQSMDSHISQAIFKIRTLSQENIYPKINIPVKIVAHKTEGIYFYPTPLSDTDLIEAGGSVQYEEDPQSKIEKLILDRKSPGRDWNTCSAHAARIPISKIRELVDQDDVEQLVTYRCEQCAKCEECRRTPRVTAVSLQEAREQKIIEDSVKFDFINKRVEVILPFLKNPNTFLTEKHQGSSNMRQARRIYMTQCKKSTEDKAGTRLTHADLIKRGFMVKLLDMPTDCQKLVREAPFNHYYPWFIVSKEDSISTPRRIVVDPSCTGLNQILPKGENRIGTIPDIIIRNRTKPIGWASDISKMYNQLRLDKSAYPFSLFLFHESLSSEIEPDTYVMVRAWYGVVQTGQQAGYALDHLAEIGRVDFPLAPECIARDRYVDDILPGADSIQEVDEQISQVKQLLSRAGFSLKYVIKTGDIPDESASSDGETIKMLGYKWHTVQDTLHPGISELNVNKKIRGTQKPNPTPIVTEDDAESILKSASLSRRIIISKIAEFFDPVGLWEPMKLQLKLHSARLNSLPWDQKLSSEEENFWKTRLIQFVRFRDLSAPRCTIPPDSESSSGIRLICMSDAGASAGGAAVYAGRKLHDGTWTCSLLTSRSRLMKATVPRNELSAILMMAELAFVAKKSLGSRVSRIIYLTDSNIAMSWMQNTNIKLRAYTFARVEASRRLIQMTTGEEEIPIFHIDGPKNIADLLTKYHELSIQDLSTGSLWQCGHPWMHKDEDHMNLHNYEDLKIDTNSTSEITTECFSEPFIPDTQEGKYSNHGIILQHFMSKCFDDDPDPDLDLDMDDLDETLQENDQGIFAHTVSKLDPPPPPPLDMIKYGWERGISILNNVFWFCQNCLHRLQKCEILNFICPICKKKNDPRDNRDLSKLALYRHETIMIKSTIHKQRLVKYFEQDGILKFQGRFSKDNPIKFVNLDNVPFLDSHLITDPIPIVRADSHLLYSFIIEVHCNRIPHAGVETTVREVLKEMMPIRGLRNLIKRIKSDCLKCRMLERKTVELQMSQHPGSRTLIAPPFFHMMIDIAFGFKGQTFKKSRTSLKFYAFVGVCILTGATNILLLEGLQTQDVILALERHSSRHGIPSEVFVDNGTQLMALKDVEFSIRDIDAEVYRSMGIRVHDSTAKSHEERGRVERKIKSIREMLERTGIKATDPMTSIQWETTFAKISSALNDLPMAHGDNSNSTNLGFEIISPNRLLIGRNNFRSLEGIGIDMLNSQIPTEILNRNRDITSLWYQVFLDNIHMLMLKPLKFLKSSEPPTVNSIVLFTLLDGLYSKQLTVWKLGKVIEVENRRVKISYASMIPKIGNPTKCEIYRNFREVSIIYSVDDVFINTTEHFCNATRDYDIPVENDGLKP